MRKTTKIIWFGHRNQVGLQILHQTTICPRIEPFRNTSTKFILSEVEMLSVTSYTNWFFANVSLSEVEDFI